MTEGSVWRHIVRFALPVFWGNLFQQLYNVVDSLVVGNFLGSDALAAVGSSSHLIFLLVGLFSGIFTGASVVISRYYGARDDAGVRMAVHTTVAFGLVVGGILGAVAGFFGGAVDNVIMRLCDVFLAVPMMLMAIVIVAALGASITNLVISLAISSVPTFARIVRSAVLSVRDMEYVEAARAIGVRTGRTIFRYILPNCMGPIIVQTTLRIAATISNTAALSFLGLGVKEPQPEWGALLSSGREFIRDSGYLATIPGICIMLTILALNLLGDGLRDALDPRLK